MKTSSEPHTNRPSPLKTAPYWLWPTVNQLAFPGLGTIMARRRGGYAQAALMVVGFVLTMAFLLWFIICSIRYAGQSGWSEAEFYAQYRPYKWALYWGLGSCAFAWTWSLFTSIAILRAEKHKPRQL